MNGAERFRRAHLDVEAIGPEVFVARAGHRPGVFIPKAEMEEVATCVAFATLPQIVRRLSVISANKPEQVSARVQRWIGHGLLESETQIVTDCVSHAGPDALPPLQDLGIFACDDHLLLERARTSWLEWGERRGRSFRPCVLDDSSDPGRALGQREVVRRVAERFAVRVTFVDHGAKRRLAAELATRSGVDVSVISFGMLGCETPRFGAGGSRTAWSLLRPSQRVLCADDDVIARFAEPPGAGGPLWITSSQRFAESLVLPHARGG